MSRMGDGVGGDGDDSDTIAGELASATNTSRGGLSPRSLGAVVNVARRLVEHAATTTTKHDGDSGAAVREPLWVTGPSW